MFGMTDVVRLASRVALVAAALGLVASIWLILANIEVPMQGVNYVTMGIGKGRAVLEYWAPEFVWILNAAILWIAAEFTLWTIQKTALGIKFALDVWGR